MRRANKMASRQRKRKSQTSGDALPQKKSPLKPRARLLSLLGEQLIGNDQLAIFELVKNSYDADASAVTVELTGLDSNNPSIIITDDGEGMSLDTLVNVWLEPGNDHRDSQRKAGARSSKYRRLPLGEKGVGRFAVHKLGNEITLHTRRIAGPELHLHINWNDLIARKYLSDTRVSIYRSKSPAHFKSGSHGTRIEISALKRVDWTRGSVRRLQRLISAINSPFNEQGAFKVTLVVNERKEWLHGIPSAKDLIEDALWRFDFELTEDGFSWRYRFLPPKGAGIKGREINSSSDILPLPSEPGKRNKVVFDSSMLNGIGPVTGNIVAYDKDPKIRKLLPGLSLLDEFLENVSGVRVYRDGMRVFNYGEPDDDWLGLDLRRVNRPTEKLSRNIVIGAISIGLEDSFRLKEKTNREGFDESGAYAIFRNLVLSAVSKFETERAIDKVRLKSALEGARSAADIPVEKPLADLKAAVKSLHLDDKLLPYIEKVEKDYNEIRELMLKTGMAGLNLSIIFHEAERGVRGLYKAIHRKDDIASIESQASSLMLLFEDISGLLRKKGSKSIVLREVIQTVARISAKRFERHQVMTTYEIGGEDDPAVVAGSADLLVGALTNLVDNALYWLRVKWPNLESGRSFVRRIHFKVVNDADNGVQLLIADNGTGFKDDPEMLVRPFFTRRPDGMGLGLYYASLAMQLNGGQLIFPERDDFDLPEEINGAVVSLFFPEGRVKK
jgi:signal transduction histidine kinase